MVTADNRDFSKPGDPVRGVSPDLRTWDECLRIGQLMASEAERIVAKAAVQKQPALRNTTRRVEFPVESAMMRAIVAGSPLKYPHTDDFRITVQVNLLTLGNAQILTIPGEALPNIGFYLKRKMKGEAQSAVRTDERRIRLHPDKSRFRQFRSLRLRVAHQPGRNDGRDSDRKCVGNDSGLRRMNGVGQPIRPREC